MKKILLAFIALILTHSLNAQQFSYELWQRANAGDLEAQYDMGDVYRYGRGVTKNITKAIDWYTKAANKGHVKAMKSLYCLYMIYAETQPSYQNAKYWLEMAAGYGDVQSMNNLGYVYANGKYGFPQDAEKSSYWYRMANSGQRPPLPNTKQSFDPAKPPILFIDDSSVRFVDLSGNNAIDADETCYVEFVLRNVGKGCGYNCHIETALSGSTKGIHLESVLLPDIEAGESKTISVPLKAGIDTETGSLEIQVSVVEPNGFGTDPFSVRVNTRQFVQPLLKITDYALIGAAGTLQKKIPFNLQLLLQNVEYGDAQNVEVSIRVPENVYIIEGQQLLEFDSIEAGKVHSLEYSMIANNNYTATSIPIHVNIKEKHGRYAENRTIHLAFNQVFARNKISVDEISTGPRKNIEIATLSSEVDKNIPITGVKNNNTFAIIIANENYQNDAKVDYALNDGRIFKEYCLKTLGIPESNIKLSPDATLNNLRNNISWIKDVASVYKGEAEIIFYYAGHGVPDDSSKEAFLLPVDGDGRLASQTGYSLKQLYSDLASCNTKSTLVFMDACFSGAQRNGQMLASARGVVIKAKDDAPQGNMVVFSAASAEQTAHQFADKQHGMFTYFLLKKLQETNGNVTLGELGNYIIDNVSKESIVRNSKLQTPTVTPSSVIGDWTNMKL